jgi:hypothetical protein
MLTVSMPSLHAAGAAANQIENSYQCLAALPLLHAHLPKPGKQTLA